MSAFLIGEIATFCNSAIRPECSGMDCEIVGGAQLRESSKYPGCLFVRYLVRAADGRRFAVAPDSLRKKRRGLSPRTLALIETLEVIDRVRDPQWSPA